MSDPRSLAQQFGSRLRTAVESLLENSSLRDYLNDNQAQQLLDWGVSQLQETAARTAALSTAEAQSILERQAAAVRELMRQINRLVAGVPADETGAVLAAFEQAITQWRQQPLSLPESFRLQQLVRRLTPEPEADAFNQLMAFLDQSESGDDHPAGGPSPDPPPALFT